MNCATWSPSAESCGQCAEKSEAPAEAAEPKFATALTAVGLPPFCFNPNFSGNSDYAGPKAEEAARLT